LKGIQPYGAVFDRKGIKEVMKWAFVEPEALKTVVAAHGQYSMEILNERAAKIAEQNRAEFEKWHKDHPEATTTEINHKRQKILEDRMAGAGGAGFSTGVARLSRTLYVITDAANIAKIAKADASDKIFIAFRDAVTGVANLIPTPPGKIGAYFWDRTKSQVPGQFTLGQGAVARSEAESTLGQSIDMFTDITADVMMRHGLFGDGDVPAKTHPHASINHPRGSDGDFIEGNKIVPWNKMSAAQRDAYQSWLGLEDTGEVFRDPSTAVREGFKATSGG
jgi:hypothetical protein